MNFENKFLSLWCPVFVRQQAYQRPFFKTIWITTYLKDLLTTECGDCKVLYICAASFSHSKMLWLSSFKLCRLEDLRLDHVKSYWSYIWLFLKAVWRMRLICLQWSTFDELNKLRSLVELQFGSIPSLGEPELVREIVIAKIANLKRCNRTVVSTLCL